MRHGLQQAAGPRRLIGRAVLGAVLGLAAVSGLGTTASCKRATTPTPEKLRAAHLAAMKADDPEAAYALLSPRVQARVPKAEFVARWKAQKVEHDAMLKAAAAMPAAETMAVHEGTTVHEGGRVLRWTRVDDHYRVVDGLPGRPHTATPAEAIHAFIDAARSTDLSKMAAVLGEGLAASVAEDWRERVDAISRALDDPGAIEISGDELRAELRYEPDRAIRLEQTPSGWRIVALE